jgi:alkanesulfonate monooxygenase SsuD/methylene tetrahydromethanopterin reductase-like flavin-dependent oxidoreductase (luciferase family)
MDREGQVTTDGRALAEQLGRVGLWTRQLDVQPARQVQEAIAELEALGWGSLWFWEVLGSGPLLAAEQAVLLEEDPAEARRIAREFMALYLTLPNYTGAWDRAGFGPEEQAEGGSDRLVDAVVAWGGPETISERVRAHLDAGADHVCVQVLNPDPNGLPMASWRALTPALLER